MIDPKAEQHAPLGGVVVIRKRFARMQHDVIVQPLNIADLKIHRVFQIRTKCQLANEIDGVLLQSRQRCAGLLRAVLDSFLIEAAA